VRAGRELVMRSYLIRRVSLATGIEHKMELMLTETQYKEIQPFLIGKQREVAVGIYRISSLSIAQSSASLS
jgi:hypothetical protein